jgi:NAD(P)-dependent dehydrogenase (short-subunit alcohol dehydrogenase family)
VANRYVAVLAAGFFMSMGLAATARQAEQAPQQNATPANETQATEQPREGVIVFGGNRATGLEVVKSLVARGEKVTVMVRPSSDTTELKKLGVTLVEGDAMDAAKIAKAAASQPFAAAVSTLGGRGSDDASSPDLTGNKNAVDAAVAAQGSYS